MKDPLKDEERLARAIADSIEPLLLVNIRHASRESASVLVVDVPFSPRPYYLRAQGPENGVYVREGSTNTKADPASDRRKTILAFLSRQGEASTAEIAEHIGLTTRATRDWLHRLQADDEAAATDHPLNSPQRRWTLPSATRKPKKATRKQPTSS